MLFLRMKRFTHGSVVAYFFGPPCTYAHYMITKHAVNEQMWRRERSQLEKSGSHTLRSVAINGAPVTKLNDESVAGFSHECVNGTNMVGHSLGHLQRIHLKVLVDRRHVVHHGLPVRSLRRDDIVQILHSENSRRSQLTAGVILGGTEGQDNPLF